MGLWIVYDKSWLFVNFEDYIILFYGELEQSQADGSKCRSSFTH